MSACLRCDADVINSSRKMNETLTLHSPQGDYDFVVDHLQHGADDDRR
mgnify:CR=1 FL=1